MMIKGRTSTLIGMKAPLALSFTILVVGVVVSVAFFGTPGIGARLVPEVDLAGAVRHLRRSTQTTFTSNRPAKMPKFMDQFMFIGDSLTQGGWQEGGFVQRLAYVYARRLDVINRGLSGYNSEWALPVFEQIFPKKGDVAPKVKLLSIWFGANDACLAPSPQHLELDRFTSNIKKMISMVQDPASEWYSPETKIFLITPPPISESAREADLASRNPPIKLDRSTENTEAFANAIKAIGAEFRLPVVDIYEPIWNATDYGDPEKLEQYLGDGLHLTKDGYTILNDLVVDTIKKSYPELYYENIPFVYPPWAELNWADPRSSLKQ